MKQVYIFKILTLGFLMISMAGCTYTSHPTSANPSKKSLSTGAIFNQGEDSLQIYPLIEQAKGPGMVFIGGRMITLGVIAEKSPHDSIPQVERTVTVAPFYIAETATTNVDWREYMHDVQLNGSEEEYKKTIPNEEVWKRDLAFNDDLVNNGLRSPAFSYYPVVGVSWVQANAYCEWRTHAVNKVLAEKAGVEYDPEDIEELVEAGIAVAGYRLAIEAEWECAARSLSIQEGDVLQPSQRVYAWDGLSLRGKEGRNKGKFLANFKRGPGDYGEGATCSVYEYFPTEEGVYIGHGNVREWVYDLYRPLSSQDVEDFNPVRRDDTLDPADGYDSKNNNSLVDNNARVVKGCSWKDCGYWLQIGTRRYLDADESNAMTGFRCAMTSLGSMKQ